MELRADRFERQLAGEPLRPAYLIAGSEPLIVQECADAVRASTGEIRSRDMVNLPLRPSRQRDRPTL